jgi:hypothetical protein
MTRNVENVCVVVEVEKCDRYCVVYQVLKWLMPKMFWLMKER